LKTLKKGWFAATAAKPLRSGLPSCVSRGSPKPDVLFVVWIALSKERTCYMSNICTLPLTSIEAMEILAGLKEGDELSALQHLINTGEVWSLEGSMGRAAMAAIQAGDCMLGEEPRKDFYGHVIPSRHDVEPGTIGSEQYHKRRRRDH
jgi:hypothetical protein